jgi:RimJ/RimL family protein N-acetyltransferase
MNATTERLVLRPIQDDDKEQIFAYRSDAETNQFQGWIPTSLEDVERFIGKQPAVFNTPDSWFQLVIVEKPRGLIIGDIGIHFIGSEQFEFGITIHKQYQQHGYATEALRAVINHLFNDLHKHRATASIDPDNHHSIRLVERLGLRKEAHFKESLFFKGRWVDDLVYAVLKKEWTSNQQ